MARRRKKDGLVLPIGADVTSVLRGMARGLKHAHPEIWASWPTIVGPEVSRRAVPKSMNGRTLVIAVANSSWLQELTFLRAEIIERLAEAVGPGVVRDIRMVLDPELGREAG